MKRAMGLLGAMLFLTVTVPSLAGPEVAWERLLPRTVECGNDVIAHAPSAAGDVYVLTAECLIRYTATGDRPWARRMPGDAARGSVLVDPEGRPIVRAKHEVVKWGADGKDLWRHERKPATGPGYERMFLDPRGDVILAGQLGRDDQPGALDIELTKLDGSSGKPLWTRKVDGPRGVAILEHVIGDSRGDVHVAGTARLAGGKIGALFFRIDGRTGELAWSALVDDTPMSLTQALAVSPDGRHLVAIAGQLKPRPNRVLRFESGKLVSTPLPWSGDGIWAQANDDGTALVGVTGVYPHPEAAGNYGEYFLAKLGRDGGPQWKGRGVPHPGYGGAAFLPDGSGGVYLLATRKPDDPSRGDLLELARFRPDGEELWRAPLVPKGYVLPQARGLSRAGRRIYVVAQGTAKRPPGASPLAPPKSVGVLVALDE